MKISLNWLQDYLTLNTENIAEITATLTDKVSEVEEVFSQSEGLEKVFVGKILEISAHPNADKMRVTQTQVGNETFQIVCGANNIEVGQKVPVALVGASLPGGFEIKKADKRGVESCGMICSETELGLTDSSEGILVLPESAPLGMPIIEYLGLNDTIFEVENTTITNRPDLFAHIGYVQEFSATGLAVSNGKAEKILYPQALQSSGKFPFEITIENPEICHRMCGVFVQNFQIQDSPEWMKKRLLACGIRPINNLVDITNYVMLELGMPLHAFDADLIAGKKITMRVSSEGEKVTTLDGEERKLPANVIVMNDEQKIFDLCGIMGGENSGIQNTTKNVWLHAPVYHATLIRRAAVALGHRTDAATIYEKRVPTGMAMPGLIRAVELMKELCPNCIIASEVLDIQNDKETSKTIVLKKSTVTRMLGEVLENTQIENILVRLGFQVKALGETFEVQVPFFRMKDMEIEEDLVEEIVRIYGLKNIQSELPLIQMKQSKPAPGFLLEKSIKNILAETAFETINFSFLGKKLLERTRFPGFESLIEVANPISEELSLMRPMLLAYLLEKMENNRLERESFAMFELGRVFGKNIEGRETKHLAYLAYNQDFFAVKLVLQNLADELGFAFQIKPATQASFLAHPGQAAEILFQGKLIGEFATLHPHVEKEFHLQKGAVYFEMDITAMLQSPKKITAFKEFNRLPKVERDQNFLLEKTTLVGDFIRKISKASPLLLSLSVVDVYEGEKIEAGLKSVTLRAVYQSPEKTLTDEEVDVAHKALIQSAEKNGAKVRM